LIVFQMRLNHTVKKQRRLKDQRSDTCRYKRGNYFCIPLPSDKIPNRKVNKTIRDRKFEYYKVEFGMSINVPE
jgi:hypothetical protein